MMRRGKSPNRNSAAEDDELEPTLQTIRGNESNKILLGYLPFIALVLLVIGASFVVRFTGVDLNCLFFRICSSEALPERDILQEYCAGRNSVGNEGYFSGSETFSLEHVVLNIRHGDRAPLFTIPGLIIHDEVLNGAISSKDVEEIKHFDSFYLQRMEDYQHHYLDPLNATRLDEISKRGIALGQLTIAGFQQHLKLGKHLRRAYKPLLSQITSPNQIFIRSTNFERTIQVDFYL